MDARDHLFSVEGGASSLLGSLVPLFKDHPDFGVCLVHAHCELESGEKMVTCETGRVTEPIFVDDGDEDCYPERWLANGDPYEFGRNSKGEVPKELIESFYGHLKSYGGRDLTDLLGFCSFRDSESESDEDIVWVERTEERRNIVEPLPRGSVNFSKYVTAAWRMIPNGDGPGEFKLCDSCPMVCVPASPHYKKHKVGGVFKSAISHKFDNA